MRVAWDDEKPVADKIRVFIPLVVMFGPRPGPNQFCRVSAGLLEVANVYLAVCAVVHVDDTIIIDTEGVFDGARRAHIACRSSSSVSKRKTRHSRQEAVEVLQWGLAWNSSLRSRTAR